MKKSTLTTAIMAGLTGAAGMVGVANAVNVNPDGLGQVLLYPYYTTRGGNDTLISVVNTTSDAKAVKIRFLEGRNSREVLDFNIYMSPFDVWTATLTEQPGETPEESGTFLRTGDNTCTVPYFFGEGEGPDGIGQVDFKDFEFIEFDFPGDDQDVDNTDGAGTDLERVQSGYFEIIEMGTLTNDSQGSADAADHGTTGVPEDCQQFVDAWTDAEEDADDGYWVVDDTVDIGPPGGGIFGGASIVDVQEGTLVSYNAEAIDNWSSAEQHSRPQSVLPRIINTTSNTSNVFLSGAVVDVDTQTWAESRDAVNAILTRNQIMNEYAINPLVGGTTEWVLTFPTKRFHVDPGLGLTEPIAPFANLFDNGSCEPVSVSVWDREEQEPGDEPGGSIVPVPSPIPPGFEPEPETFDLCWEANVVRFADSEADDVDATEFLGENRFVTLPLELDADMEAGTVEGFFSGWASFDFSPEEIDDDLDFPDDARTITATEGATYVGLPVIGFAIQGIVNSELDTDGDGEADVLSNYGASFTHRGTRRIDR